jgi:hypothetical protein
MSTAAAQVVLPPMPPPATPWNAQRVFEPVPFARRWEIEGGDGIRPEDTPVRTRVHPGYEPPGIRAGTWMFHPSLMVGGFYNSNVFASPTDKRSDIALRVRPSLSAHTLWGRHAVAIQADMLSETYREFSQLDTIDASVKANGRIDVRHDIAVLTNFRAARLNEAVGSLASPTGAVEPTPYTYITGDATYWQQFNRLTASAGTRIESYDFGSTVSQTGQPINQDSRDGQIYVGHGRLEYVVSPRFGVFTAVEGNRRDLRGTPAQPLSSEGYRVLGGVSLQYTNLLSGEIGVGYSDQNFDAETIARIAGPAYRALLTWSPTRLIDVHFKAERIVTQAADTIASGVQADALQLGVDYELRRNVVLSVAGMYEVDRFVGQIRKDKVYSTLAEVKYLFNRYSFVSLRHQYVNRDSNIPSSVYDKHEVGINVTAQF